MIMADHEDPRKEEVQRPLLVNESQDSVDPKSHHGCTLGYISEIMTYILTLVFTAYWPWDKARKMIPDSTNRQCSRGHCLRDIAITLATALPYVSFIIVGILYQSAICFSRQNPYAHLRRSPDYNESLDNSSNHCLLRCDVDKNFVNGFLVPDIAIVLVSFWMYLMEKLIIICLEKCSCKKRWLYNLLEELTIFSAGFEKLLEKSNEEIKKESTVKVYSVISLLYIFCSLGLDISYVYVFDITHDDLVIQSSVLSTNNSKNFKKKAIILSILGFIAIDLLYIQVITRYAYRCDFTIQYLNSIKNRDDQLKEKVKNAYHYIRELNKSTITAIVVVITGFTAISCVINLVTTPDCTMNSATSPESDNDKISSKQIWQFVAVALRLILWTILTVAPFFKAAQVNKSLNRLRFDLVMCDSSDRSNSSRYAKGVKYMSTEFKFFGISVISALPNMIIILLFSAVILGSNIKYLNLL